MSAERNLPDDSDPSHSMLIYTCEAYGEPVDGTAGHRRCFVYDASGREVQSAETWPAPLEAAGRSSSAVHVETLEFRLAGSERQERRLPLAGPGPWVAVARSVRGYLTRSGQADSASSRIGGIEFDARVEDRQLVCRAALSDFAAGDLVVVRAEVELHTIR